MINYSIVFNGINEQKNTFHYKINSDVKKSVILRVFNTFFNYKEYEIKLSLSPNINYWTYVPSSNKNRYVEFRDEETLEIVGLFGLEGIVDWRDIDYSSYVKKIFENSTAGEKNTIYFVFNEITNTKVYHNDFVGVEEGDLVVDIGFNYGLFSLESLKYKPSKIIAFEPNPKLVEIFNKLYHSNIIDLHQKAVSNQNGKVKFYEHNTPGMSSLYKEVNNDATENLYEVESIDFNDFLIQNKIEKIDYLKIDCEGSEYFIIESIREFLKSNVRKVAIEFHHQIQDQKVQRMIENLRSANFELKIINEEGSSLGMIYGRK